MPIGAESGVKLISIVRARTSMEPRTAKPIEQEVVKLKESLRGRLNAVLMKFLKAGPGILRKLWAELLEERFEPTPKQPRANGSLQRP